MASTQELQSKLKFEANRINYMLLSLTFGFCLFYNTTSSLLAASKFILLHFPIVQLIRNWYKQIINKSTLGQRCYFIQQKNLNISDQLSVLLPFFQIEVHNKI